MTTTTSPAPSAPSDNCSQPHLQRIDANVATTASKHFFSLILLSLMCHTPSHQHDNNPHDSNDPCDDPYDCSYYHCTDR